MQIARTALTVTLAIALVACGGGDGGGTAAAPPTGGTSGGTTTQGTGCSLAERQRFVLDVMNEWYLFPELLDTTVDPTTFTDLQSYIDALVAPARAQSRDKFFSFITSIEEENRLIETGSNAGFGIRLAYDTSANRVFILEAFENAPAFPAGMDRGSELLEIDNQTISSLMASGGPQAVINALGPTDPGVSRRLRFTDANGDPIQATITKAEFALDPISDRYGVEILNDGTEDVGYINLRTFIVQDAGPQLRDAFQQFQTQGIDRVVLDLRYNGGGLVSVAELLGDLMGAGRQGQVFSNTILRESKSSENETRLFSQQPEGIGVTKLAIIGRRGTASASELVTNSFIPFLGADLALVGENTSGKPVGQFGFDRTECDDRLRAVTFQTTNADNDGEYFTGLASVVDTTCRAADDFDTPLGDAGEASISVALDFMAGRTCTPIITEQAQRAQSVGGMRMLEAERPTAAQREMPGLF